MTVDELTRSEPSDDKVESRPTQCRAARIKAVARIGAAVLAAGVTSVTGWWSGAPLWAALSIAIGCLAAIGGYVAFEVRHSSHSARIGRGRTVAVLAALTTSLLLYSAVTYFVRYSDERDSAAIAEDAAATAGELSAAALSYTADSVEADVNAAKSHLTGEFLASYSELAANSIIPQATRDGITTKWEVSGTSLISAHLGSAEALVFLRGTVSSQVNPEPQFMTSSVRVRLEHGNDQWRIAQLEPI